MLQLRVPHLANWAYRNPSLPQAAWDDEDGVRHKSSVTISGSGSGGPAAFAREMDATYTKRVRMVRALDEMLAELVAALRQLDVLQVRWWAIHP